MLAHVVAVFSGAAFVLAVIAGIGPQNLYIISHAVKRDHTLTVATTCCLADLALLFAGSIGLTLSGSKTVLMAINVVGILFMVWYIYTKIKTVFRHHEKFKVEEGPQQSRKQIILKALALTWLNPLVFIDMIVVIGGTATHYNGWPWFDFMLGAVIGDFIWVYGITFLAYSFSEQLNRVGVWIALDLTTIVIMLFILYKTIGFVI